MDIKQITELLFGLLTVVSAGFVTFSPKLMHAGFGLLFTFFGVAGLYVFMGADFLAATQVLVYIGGVLVLLLFGILLTSNMPDADLFSSPKQRSFGTFAGILLLALLAKMIFGTDWPVSAIVEPVSTAHDLGIGFMTRWLLPFEVASVLLLGALIGSLHLARNRKED
jgi:NADH:ubiquinone oxidoreductase subunit 6 (subunit J)